MTEPRYVLGEPAYLHIPDGRRGSYGDIVGEVAEMMHRPLDPHQLIAVDAINSYGPGGHWLAMESVVVGPRQVTGKTGGIALPSVVANMLTWQEADTAVWSAHRMRAVMATVKDLERIIEGSEEFSSRVRKFKTKDDDAELTLTNGSSLIFMTRTDGNARSLGASEVVDDEALYFTDSMAGDLIPIVGSKTNPRLLHLSSAPKTSSAYLHRLMARGRAGAPGLIYVEFRAPGSWEEPGCQVKDCRHDGVPGCALDDLDRVLFAAPSIVHGRVRADVVGTIRKALPVREFAREMFGWEEPPPSGDGIKLTATAWESCSDPTGAIVGAPVMGLDVAPDAGSASLCLAGRREDDMVQVWAGVHRDGDDWVLAELRKAFEGGVRVLALDGGKRSQAAAYAPDAESIGFTVVQLGAGDIVEACVGLQRDVRAGDRLRHSESPDVPGAVLTQALAVATTRPVGDGGGWAWARTRSDGDITPLVAVTVARWALLQGSHEQPFFAARR